MTGGYKIINLKGIDITNPITLQDKGELFNSIENVRSKPILIGNFIHDNIEYKPFYTQFTVGAPNTLDCYMVVDGALKTISIASDGTNTTISVT